jgi:hypothetical protein
MKCFIITLPPGIILTPSKIGVEDLSTPINGILS